MTSFRITCTVALLLAGCGATDAPIALESWCEELLRAERARVGVWECTAAEILTDEQIEERCRTSFPGTSLHNAVDRGDVEWDDRLARAYVDHVASGSPLPSDVIPTRPVRGHVAVGAPCTSFEDTAGGLDDCAAGAVCTPPHPGAAEVCVQMGHEGDPCADEAHRCDLGFHCDTEADEPRCVALPDPGQLGPGAECTNHDQCASHVCGDGVCRGPFPLGSECVVEADWGVFSCGGCAAGCTELGVCAQLCDESAYCDGEVCVVRHARGQACSFSGQCEGIDWCDDGTCEHQLCRFLP